MTPFELLFIGVSLLFLLGGIDDLFIDLAHLKFGLRPTVIPFLRWELWRAKTEKPIAILIPAWQESAVLEAMVRTNLHRVRYSNYRWFVGVYPNDIDTLSIAKRLEILYPEKIIVVVADRPGPTSKAHCLNCILKVISGMVGRAREEDAGWIPHYIAIHDAEDVVHPDSFTAVNAQSEDLDFIQVPIFSLPVPASQWVSGTYLDEFAEIHLKEIPVRQVLGMPIPSAGVGTFLSIDIVMKMGKRFGYWFDEGNLTEDYEISWRIARLGGKQLFLLLMDETGDIVATREYFPRELGRSIRQKTRWTTGIGLQTRAKWKSFGVLRDGHWTLREMLTAYAIFRDRKALWANPTVLAAWFMIVSFSLMLLSGLDPKLFSTNHQSLMLGLILVNSAFFGWRMIQRARFCSMIYGKKHGALAIPRVLLSTYINAAACFRAIRNYRVAAQSRGEVRIEWDKTDHQYPDLLSQTSNSTEKQAK